MKYIASCSCGKDSLAMVLRLIEEKAPLDHVVFFDAGKEFQSIYDTWTKLTKILDENGIKHDVIKSAKSFDYYFAEHEIKTKDGSFKRGYSWCGGRCRWMTTFKTRAINAFYKTYEGEQVAEYIGIASDELERVKMERGKTLKIYPLIYWNMKESDCFTYCYKHGFDWKESNGVSLYQVLDRVSCYCCGNKNLKELKAVYKHLPNYWEKLKTMQEQTPIPFRDGKTISDLERNF